MDVTDGTDQRGRRQRPDTGTVCNRTLTGSAEAKSCNWRSTSAIRLSSARIAESSHYAPFLSPVYRNICENLHWSDTTGSPKPQPPLGRSRVQSFIQEIAIWNQRRAPQ